ncbi:MAG TPA: DNA polymerase I, partial [Tenericutes bacterium]|nr:DNA polymerase I [Mycoplasmatota bacterium]
MKKLILVDGNNLIFRSYFATAYSGNMMKNSKGFPTNAIYGMVNMLNKVINDEKPDYMVVAFDTGKTFRHEEYEDYKKGRAETPDDLLIQFDKAKEVLTGMGIKHLEIENYEADDIIGTIAEDAEKKGDIETIVVSSDKDLLQLIDKNTKVKLIKKNDFLLLDEEGLKKEMGITPSQVIDLKALEGDPSDNIPGVKGIGEKTALKLLSEYGSLENIYQNIDKITGKVRENLELYKEDAMKSYRLVTLYKDVPLDYNFEDLKYQGINKELLTQLFEELEFYSFFKKIDVEEQKISTKDVNILFDITNYEIPENAAIYLEIPQENYHNAEILGLAIYDGKENTYIPYKTLKTKPEILLKGNKITYDLKRQIVALRWQGLNLLNVTFDSFIAAYLLNKNIKNDIAYLANNMGYNIPFAENFYKSKDIKNNLEEVAKYAVSKAKFIYDTYDIFKRELEINNQNKLFYDLEIPLIYVLADMEFTGVNIDTDFLLNMGEKIKEEINRLEKEIYTYAGEEFNISSPKQLGVILFEKLNLPHGKKKKTGYSTSREVLEKLINYHDIIPKILEYRTYTKLQSTYIEGLINARHADGKIHTIFNQALTQTGRLSSVEPNIQNIPMRYPLGREIRKAFIPSPGNILFVADYSQIELRILAHMSRAENLINAFNNDMDIHTKTAMDIFKVHEDEVTPAMRRQAKAVNFGIIYGISGYGLSENLDINIWEAEKFIKSYLDTYPGIKEYMDNVIKKAREDGYVKTLFNRIRIIDEINNKNYMIRQYGERMALNTPIQGTAADIIKKAMVEIYEKMKKLNLKSKLIIQVHDELIFDVVLDELEILEKLVKDTMENTYELLVPLK